MGILNSVLQKMKLAEYAEGADLDAPQTTELRRNIIMNKPFLRKLYEEWYKLLIKETQDITQGKKVEIGSGAGFLKEMMPDVITSDIMPLSTCDMTFMAEDMPFENEELSAILMVDVLHHIPKPELFFKEAVRTLKPGGKVIMIEPANSFWGRFIYKRFHHEPFNPEGNWEIPSSGPLSGANGALPWIMFVRDRHLFEKKFPQLSISKIKYHTPFTYLLSGGLSFKTLVPEFSYKFWRFADKILSGILPQMSMFQFVVIEKIKE